MAASENLEEVVMPQCMHAGWPSRRLFLCCSASATLSAFMGTLPSTSVVARAEALSADVPTVDP
jgi:7,8-dihydropterin-6-yl-methyl-4-(beta-D-ribofuranosyl)aminobenzene 5'-phosphate synthase